MTMNRSTLDVKTEVRKLAGTKPVQAAAGGRCPGLRGPA